MKTKILGIDDITIVPKYVDLIGTILNELIPYYPESTIESAIAGYNENYVKENLREGSESRFIACYTHMCEELSGFLIEGFDHLDGNRTLIKWIGAKEKGIGVGTIMINDCIKRAKYEGKDNVSLGVSVANTNAIKLYKKLGFIRGETYNSGKMLLMGYIF